MASHRYHFTGVSVSADGDSSVDDSVESASGVQVHQIGSSQKDKGGGPGDWHKTMRYVPAAKTSKRVEWMKQRAGGYVEGESCTTISLDANPVRVRYVQLRLRLPAAGQDHYAVRHVLAIGPDEADEHGRKRDGPTEADVVARESVQFLLGGGEAEEEKQAPAAEEPEEEVVDAEVEAASAGFMAVKRQREQNLKTAAAFPAKAPNKLSHSTMAAPAAPVDAETVEVARRAVEEDVFPRRANGERPWLSESDQDRLQERRRKEEDALERRR